MYFTYSQFISKYTRLQYGPFYRYMLENKEKLNQGCTYFWATSWLCCWLLFHNHALMNWSSLLTLTEYYITKIVECQSKCKIECSEIYVFNFITLKISAKCLWEQFLIKLTFEELFFQCQNGKGKDGFSQWKKKIKNGSGNKKLVSSQADSFYAININYS